MVFPSFHLSIYLFSTQHQTLERDGQRERGRERSATVKVMWFEPPPEHLPLANTTTGVPCRRTNTIGVPCRCRTPPLEFPAAA
ncbi:hypothetical protein HanIR_Chr14g0698241 [Helianthus annuus]|nr:hypothetical protein HanIR_Chr14g0698241 [Helianthus annuus]